MERCFSALQNLRAYTSTLTYMISVAAILLPSSKPPAERPRNEQGTVARSSGRRF
jgi:hypothetical protein